jgi:hypothetical protein
VLFLSISFLQGADLDNITPLSKEEITDFKNKIITLRNALKKKIKETQNNKLTGEDNKTFAFYKKAISNADNALATMKSQPATTSQQALPQQPKNIPSEKNTVPKKKPSLLENFQNILSKAEEKQNNALLHTLEKESQINSLKRLPAHLKGDWLAGVLTILSKQTNRHSLWITDNFKNWVNVIESRSGLIVLCNVKCSKSLESAENSILPESEDRKSKLIIKYDFQRKIYTMPQRGMEAEGYFYISQAVCEQARSIPIKTPFHIDEFINKDLTITHECSYFK